MSDKTTVERWWAEMCWRYEQDPCDPDAFWNVGPVELKARCDEFKTVYGFEPTIVETDF